VAIDELVSAAVDGSLTESFGSGTAAVVTPVGTIGYQGKDYTIGDGKPGPMTRKFYQQITDLQYGRASDPHGWMRIIE